MKQVLISIATVLILFILQTGLFHYLSFDGIVPNLLLIVVCSYGFLRGETEGVIAGFFCGLLIDIFYSRMYGFNSLIFLYLGYFNGMLNRFYMENEIKLPIAFIGISDLIYSVVTYCLRFLLNGKFDFGFYFIKIILPEFLYTLGVSLLLYPFLRFLELRVIPVSLVKKEEDEDVI